MPAQQWFSTRFPELLKHPHRETDRDRDGQTETGGRPQAEVVQCVQTAGDAIFVPEGWGHAILNLLPSVGFASEFENRGEPLSYQPGETHATQAADEVHEVPWCNHPRWREHLYTCREL